MSDHNLRRFVKLKNVNILDKEFEYRAEKGEFENQSFNCPKCGKLLKIKSATFKCPQCKDFYHC